MRITALARTSVAYYEVVESEAEVVRLMFD
jgi:hypothetical protein